jgi:actin-like ATPase involved in cell morphogenesis
VTYALGIDLGTTYTAAAVLRDGRAEIASLGSRAAAIPSVVLLREDETILTGEAANRRALTEPHRVAREFKRRLGDTTPILLGGAPYSAEALMARLLRSVVQEVATREGSQPTAVCITHPANWGPYKTDLLVQAVRIANLDVPARLLTEPEAAAVFYASQQRIDAGAVIAVYDLGGGTFDAAILRKSADGFEILGQPEGIERLGGIDFDAAVFNHVARALGGKLDELDEDDPAAIAAVARLREECTEAKEALSSDTDVSIPVLLPNVATEVRLTRAEFEAMVRPALHDSIEALKRAMRSAGVGSDELHAVLLVGGSSRMPIVSQLVGAELGRPVAVDAHPKHAVALGAALIAGGMAGAPPRSAATPLAPPAPAASASPAAPAPAAAEEPSAALAAALSSGDPTAITEPTGAPAVPPAPTPPEPAPRRERGLDEPPTRTTAATPPLSERASRAGDTGPPAPPAPRGGGPAKKRPIGLLVGAGLAVAVLAALAIAIAGGGGDDAGDATSTTTAAPTTAPDDTAASTTASDSTGAVTTVAPETTLPATTLPLDEQCTDTIKANVRWVCLTSATIEGDNLVIAYEASDGGVPFAVNGGFHLHVYGGDGTAPDASVMGTQALPNQRGAWYVEDQNPSVRAVTSADFLNAIGLNTKVCARIADANHALVTDGSGGFATGNCVPITRG